MSSIKIRDKGKTFTITGVKEEDLALLKRKRSYTYILVGICTFLLFTSLYILAWNAFVTQDSTQIIMMGIEPKETSPDGQEIALGDKVSVKVTRANRQNWTKVHILTIASIALASILVAKKVHKKIGRR